MKKMRHILGSKLDIFFLSVSAGSGPEECAYAASLTVRVLLQEIKNLKDKDVKAEIIESEPTLVKGNVRSALIAIEENAIETKFLKTVYDGRYNDNWTITELPLENVLRRSGASKIVLLQGTGNEMGIESGTFTIYLYNKNRKALYEVVYYINFSQKNIHYSQRNRIMNLLLFHSLLVYLN
jgi:hypothetical protein